MEACRPYLERQLRLVRPAVILCLGAPAANTLIHKAFKITQERGQWFTGNPFAPWVMASWHPAYVLRQGGDAFTRTRAELVNDIAQCRRKVIELRQQGGLLARAAAEMGEARDEGAPNLSLF
jgi:DNA polymerase